jgi:hypothetical protein
LSLDSAGTASRIMDSKHWLGRGFEAARQW